METAMPPLSDAAKRFAVKLAEDAALKVPGAPKPPQAVKTAPRHVRRARKGKKLMPLPYEKQTKRAALSPAAAFSRQLVKQSFSSGGLPVQESGSAGAPVDQPFDEGLAYWLLQHRLGKTQSLPPDQLAGAGVPADPADPAGADQAYRANMMAP